MPEDESKTALDDAVAEASQTAALVNERDATDAVSDEAVPATAKRLRIATYNIHKGVTSRRNRIHELRAGLHALEADLVFLQEVQGRNDVHAQRFGNWPDIAQHTFLAGDHWAQSVYGRNSVREEGDHGNAMLSRHPLVSHENIDLSDHRFESRGLLHCAFDVDGTQVHCICAHLGLFEESRVRQADAIIARIRSHVPADAPLVIAGDFNDWRHRLGRQLVEGLGVREVFSATETRRAALARKATGFVKEQRDRLNTSIGARIPAQLSDALGTPLRSAAKAAGKSMAAVKGTPRARIAAPARTYPSGFPLLRLDRIYVRGFRIASAQVLQGPTWRKLSDHAPILTELVFA